MVALGVQQGVNTHPDRDRLALTGVTFQGIVVAGRLSLGSMHNKHAPYHKIQCEYMRAPVDLLHYALYNIIPSVSAAVADLSTPRKRRGAGAPLFTRTHAHNYGECITCCDAFGTHLHIDPVCMCHVFCFVRELCV